MDRIMGEKNPEKMPVRCLLVPSGDAVQSQTPAAVAYSVSDTRERQRRERDSVRIALQLLPALTVLPILRHLLFGTQ